MKKNEYGLQERPKRNKRGLLTVLLLIGLAVLAVAAMWAATQKAAADCGFQSGLGKPWFAAFGMLWYAPWSIFDWSARLAPSVLDGAMTLGQIIFIGPLFLVGACIVANSKNRGNATLHGSAHWARKEEIERLGYFSGQGVYVGGWWDKKKKQQFYLRHNGPEHILCFAPTRSGKGVGLILPTLLSWPGSSLTLDIKGENWALTSGWRKSQGHTVLRFDPADASGSGCCFNPVEEIRLTSLEAIQDVQNMALMLVDPDGKGLEDHWTKAAFGFFSGLILHCCIKVRAEKGRSANLNDLTLMMANEGQDTDALLNEMLDERHEELYAEFAPGLDPRIGREAHTFIASSAREMKSKSDKEASGVLSSALVNMALYRDPIVTMNTAQSDFHIQDLMNAENGKPVDLYLVVSPASADRVRPLMRLIVDMIIRRVCASMSFKDGASVASYKHRLLLMLDEFTSLGKLPIIEKAIAYIAGYGGKMYIIVQDTKQLNGVYGKDNAIMANCHVRIAYAPNDPETADLLSKMTGQTTVVEKKVSISSGKGGSSRSTSISETARPLLTPDECMRIPGLSKDATGKPVPGHMLIFTAGNSAIYGMQILYFLDPVFSQRAKIPAPGISARFPAGITDSLYAPRPENWFTPEEKAEKPAPVPQQEPDLDFANFLQAQK